MSESTERPAPKWQPISPIERRVLGVLVEKAKTTPDAYPMSLNGICTGANQKNNRYPLMNLEPDDVEPALDSLREKGAVLLVQGGGRVQKYRHVLYEWLGVEKVEMAVMAELLLRGAQTEGELRGRAARMEPIADLTALRPVLESLHAKKLIVSLTSPGRGHVLTHALYLPRELEKVRAEANAAPMDARSDNVTAEATRIGSAPSSIAQGSAPRPPSPNPPVDFTDLHGQVRSLGDQYSELRALYDDLASELRACRDEISQLKRDLGV